MLPLPEDTGEFGTLVALIARLRAPDGCPWDRQQTHVSLRENLLAESYEVLEAIDQGQAGELCEELGDLLLQVVLHAQIAADSGEFEIGDVVRGITEKIIRRHPHIFGKDKAGNAEEVAVNWEVIKKAERDDGSSMLDGIPRQMPALGYSLEAQKRVARVGFDWDEVDGIIDKLAEEVAEFQQAGSPERQSQEFGDLLFTLVNLARRRGINAEASLRGANERFRRRFSLMEELCRRRGLDLSKMSFAEQNALWEEAKGQL